MALMFELAATLTGIVFKREVGLGDGLSRNLRTGPVLILFNRIGRGVPTTGPEADGMAPRRTAAGRAEGRAGGSRMKAAGCSFG